MCFTSCASPHVLHHLLEGVSVRRSRLGVAQSENPKADVGSSALTFILEVQLPLCCANVDVARDVYPESAHFIAFKVSAVHLRRCETLDLFSHL